MAQRRELKNISYGFFGFVFSRNFDVDGYWGVGKLYQMVNALSEQTIKLDVNPRLMDDNRSLATFEDFFANWLGQKMAHLDLPLSWTQSAYLTLNFDVPTNAHFEASSNLNVDAKFFRGDIMTAELVVISDYGHEYRTSARGHCIRLGWLYPFQRRHPADRGPKLKRVRASKA